MYVLYPKRACFRIETCMFSIQNVLVLGSKHVCLSQKHACLWWKHLCLSLKLACLGLKHSSYLSKTCMFCIEIMHVHWLGSKHVCLSPNHRRLEPKRRSVFCLKFLFKSLNRFIFSRSSETRSFVKHACLGPIKGVDLKGKLLIFSLPPL